MSAPWRRALGRRAVFRTVQGVRLELPYSHMLPVYARIKVSYGQNLVRLAAGLAARSEPDDLPLKVLDIGANVGDSALQIVAGSGARVLCLEGDAYWADYLHRNVDGTAGVVVEEVLLIPDAGQYSDASPVREHGTTRFVHDAEGPASLPALSAAAIRARNPDFDSLRLIKCDTDGLDPVLVPAVAAAWKDSAPVLFFEFDPELARAAGNDPNQMWAELAGLGYARLAIWDNAGDPLGQLDIVSAAEKARTLEPKPVELGYHFWDVAACRADDLQALAVFDELMPNVFHAMGKSA